MTVTKSTQAVPLGISVLRHLNHFVLASVQQFLGLKRHHHPTIPRVPLFKQIVIFFLVY